MFGSIPQQGELLKVVVDKRSGRCVPDVVTTVQESKCQFGELQ